MSSSLDSTSYDVEVTLPNRKKKTISISKSIVKTNSIKANNNYDATINRLQLSAYLYEKLKLDDIYPSRHSLHFHDYQWEVHLCRSHLA